MADLNVPAIEKLLDYTASGIGAVAGPMLLPWKAFWEGKAKLASARVDAEVRRIQAESEAVTSPIIAKARFEARESLLAPGAEVSGTAEITREDITQRIEFQERKRHANIKAVVMDAADDLGDKEVADHEPDPDWTARFFDSVQDVSTEEMQKIWSRILAGEVESPGRTSLRTLDTLRNMTKRDAEMFRDVCDFVILNDAVFYDDSVKDFDALRYNDLLHLQDCGLINVGPDLVRQIRWGDEKEQVHISQIGALMMKRNPNAGEVLEIPEILLTTSGKELLRFAQCQMNMEYLRAFAKFLKSKDCELSYLVGVVPLPGGMIRYSNRIPIEPQPDQAGGATP